MALMFKPAFHNFRAPFPDHAADFSNFVRLETVIESQCKVVQPKVYIHVCS